MKIKFINKSQDNLNCKLINLQESNLRIKRPCRQYPPFYLFTDTGLASHLLSIVLVRSCLVDLDKQL